MSHEEKVQAAAIAIFTSSNIFHATVPIEERVPKAVDLAVRLVSAVGATVRESEDVAVKASLEAKAKK